MIRNARPQHLPAINELAKTYGLRSLEPRAINHRDIALVAVVDGRVIGFIWMGLMAGNTRGYIDHFMVCPKHTKQGVGFSLCKRLYDRALKMGVKKVFGTIIHNEFHDNSAMNALRFGLKAHGKPCTYVFGETGEIKGQLRGVYGW